MKVYMLKDEDLERLRTAIIKVERDKLKNNYLTPENVSLVEDIHRSYNYYIETWIQEVKQ